MRTSFRLLALPATAAVVLAFASPARADEAADTATARALGVEGVTLAEAGKCKEAIEKLQRAEKLRHAPTTATRLGECEIEVGKIVRGTERLQRVIREPLSPNAHPAFVAAVARAEKVLSAALPRLSTLRISVHAPPGVKPAITIDGEAASDAIIDTARPVDPGSHVIAARADGFLASSVTTSLGEGETKNVLLELRPDPNARKHDARPIAPSAAVAGTTTESKPSKVPAILAFGVGAVGLGVGIYAATVVYERAWLLTSRCDANRVCPTDMQADIDAAKTWANVSTAGFIAAGAGVATGAVLLLLSGGSSSAQPSQKAGVRVRPAVGAASVGLDGVF